MTPEYEHIDRSDKELARQTRWRGLVMLTAIAGAVVTTWAVGPSVSSAMLDTVPMKAKDTGSGSSDDGSSSNTLSTSTSSVIADAVVTFAATNQYISRDGKIGGGKLKWTHVVEPHVETTFSALVNGISAGSGGAAWSWVIDGTTYEGSRVTHTFKRSGLHKVALQLSRGDEVTAAAEDVVMSKWVRRELRSLTDGDREAFLDALKVLYNIETNEGQRKYGARYVGMEYLVRKHLYGAASPMCDHWHDDAGLMTHHMAFTLELEQSLQSIDPTISVPYWEYSLDAYLFGDYWTRSPIFDDDWFGDVSPDNDQKTVATGRWAYTRIKSNAREYSNITNPWGLLRSPWNSNPVPYITRHKYILGNGRYQSTFPGCFDFDTAIKQTSFSEVMPYLNGLTHGPVHLMIGGEWHRNNSGVHRFWKGEQSNFLLMSKVMWRHGFMRCDMDCVEGETDKDSCVCTCPTEYLDRFTPYQILSSEYTGLLHWLSEYSAGKITYSQEDDEYHIDGYTEEEEVAAWGSIVETLCDPGWVGEMFTSAAPYDPSFWPIHTTAERFLWTRILLSQESPETWAWDDTWGYDHDIASTPSDFGEVCHWEGVEGLGLPSCVKKTCPGHNEHDTIPFGNFIGNNDTTYTNAQFWELMQPDSDLLPYTYDTYDYWWCAAQGYDWTA